MEPKKGDATIYPIAEEEEGACALPVESNENPSHPEDGQWFLTPLGEEIWERIHAGRTSSRRGGRMFIARRPFRYGQYMNDRKQGQRKSDQPKNEHGGADTSSDEAAGSKPPTAEQAAEGEQSHSKSWSSPAGYSAYFNTVQESSAPAPCKEQQSSGSANSDDNIQESYTQKKQFNRAPGSLPYARGNRKMKHISFQHGRYWVQGPDLSISNRCGEYAWNQTRRYGRAAYHNTARSGQRGDQKRVFSASGRNHCRGAANCARGGANYLRDPGNSLSDRGDFYRIGNGCPRGAGNCARGGANYLRDPGNWLSDSGDFYRIGNGCPRGTGNCTRGGANYLRDPGNWLNGTRYFSRRRNGCLRGAGNCTRGGGNYTTDPGNCLNGTGDFSRRRNCCPRGAVNGTRGGGDSGNWLNGTGDFCRRRNSYPRGGRRPSSRRGGQTRSETSYPRTDDFNRRPTVDDPEPSPAPQSNEETSPTTTIELGISTFTTPHESSLVISDSSDIVIQRVTISDNNPCDYVSIEVRAQLPVEEQQTPLWTLGVPQYIRPLCLCPQLWAADAMGYTWQPDGRPVMPVMVPQNPPIGTPVYYQQPVMGPAWSPYVPLVEAYNEMPCYPADYGNPGYYPPSYANPVYQNNPMEYMPPNPAGDPAGPPAVPPQSDVQQSEAPSRTAGCSQCGGCGSCCTCNRPRTSPPLLNHEPRTAAGPINFGAQKSVKDDGSDLPNDIATLRFFYNLGVEAHQSASRGVPNGDAEADQAEDEEKKEITNLVGRLHKVLFRQNPEPQELQNTNCSEHPTNGSEMWNTKNDSTHLPTKVVGVDLSRVETEILTRTESDVEEEEEEPQTDNGVELIYEMRCNQVLHTAMKPPPIRDLDESDNGREPLHMELFPPLPNPRVGPGRRGGRGLHDTARFPLNQRNADHPRLPPIYYVNPGKFPWSQNQKDGNMGRGIDSMRGTGRLRARRDSEDYSGGMSARPGDTNEQNSSRRK